MKHTHGPWKLTEKNAFTLDRFVYSEEKGNIALISGHMVDVEANANLIAAAPDLLEACRLALAFIDANFNIDHPVYRIINDVFKKAESDA